MSGCHDFPVLTMAATEAVSLTKALLVYSFSESSMISMITWALKNASATLVPRDSTSPLQVQAFFNQVGLSMRLAGFTAAVAGRAAGTAKAVSRTG